MAVLETAVMVKSCGEKNQDPKTHREGKNFSWKNSKLGVLVLCFSLSSKFYAAFSITSPSGFSIPKSPVVKTDALTKAEARVTPSQ